MMAKTLDCPFFEIPATKQTHAQIMFSEIVREAREARAEYAGQVSSHLPLRMIYCSSVPQLFCESISGDSSSTSLTCALNCVLM